MFNKIRNISEPKSTKVTEPMQKHDVRQPIAGSKEAGKVIALDCEMVECEDELGGKCSKLARLSVVNYNGYVIWDQHYKPKFHITNYLTRISGIKPQHLKHAPEYDDFEKDKIKFLLKDKLIIGHTLKSDFDALELDINQFKTRDLMKVEALKLEEGSALRKMCYKYLGQVIQVGEHDSAIDARATLFIYRKFRQAIEREYIQIDAQMKEQLRLKEIKEAKLKKRQMMMQKKSKKIKKQNNNNNNNNNNNLIQM